MAKKVVTNELLERVKPFYVNEIRDRVLDGITYSLLLNDTDKLKIQNYLDLKEYIKSEGYLDSDILRAFSISNGYIFDLNLAVAQRIATGLLKTAYAESNIEADFIQQLKASPVSRRNTDMVRLANKCLKVIGDSGRNECYIALYSKNSGPYIKLNGMYNGKPVAVTYDSYALRHYDLTDINSDYLCSKGIRISKIEPCDILSSKTGVKFRIVLERLDPSIDLNQLKNIKNRR